MKKIIMIISVIAIIILIVLFIMNIMKKNKIELTESNIKYIHFSYSTGNMMNANVSYKIDEEDGKYIATIKPDGKSSEEARKIEIDSKTMQKVISILNKYEVSSWHKFHKTDKHVLDGYSFSFNLETKDEKEISASGYMKWPKNYSEVSKQLSSIFDKLYNDSIIELKDINNMYFTYTTGDEVDANVRYDVKRQDEKYYAKIKLNGISTEEEKNIEVDEQTIATILQILNKYQVVVWDGFHESDTNVLDGDSFSFSFENNDISISASGYMRWPSNYSDIRQELDELFNNLIANN